MKKISTLLVFLFCVQVHATTYTWLGTTSSNWTTTSNWSPAVVPTSTDDIVVNASSSATNNLTLDQNRTIKSLTISAGKTVNLGTFTLTLTSALTCSSGSVNNGKITSTVPIAVNLSTANFMAQVDLLGNGTSTSAYATYGNTYKLANFSTINNSSFNAVGTISNGASVNINYCTFNAVTTFLNSSNVFCTLSANNFNANALFGSNSEGMFFFYNIGNDMNTFYNNATIGISPDGFSNGQIVLNVATFKNPTSSTTAENVLNMTGSASLFLSGASFENKVNFKAPSVYLTHGNFTSNVIIEQTGNSVLTTNPINENLVFQGATTLKCSGSSDFIIGNSTNGNIIFGNNLTLISTAIGRVKVGLKANVQLQGNVTNNANDPFRDNYGTVTFNGTNDQQLTGSTYKFTNFTINKPNKSMQAYANIELVKQIDASPNTLNFTAGKLVPQTGYNVTIEGSPNQPDNGWGGATIEGDVSYRGFGSTYIPISSGVTKALLGLNNTGTVDNTFVIKISSTDTYANNSSSNTLAKLEKCYFFTLDRTNTAIANTVSVILNNLSCNKDDNFNAKRVMVYNYTTSLWDMNYTGFVFLGFTATNPITIPAAETRSLRVTSGNYGEKLALNTTELPRFKIVTDAGFQNSINTKSFYSSATGTNAGILELTPNYIASGAKMDFVYNIHNPKDTNQYGQLKVTLDANYNIVETDGIWLKPAGKPYIRLIPNEHYVLETTRKIKITHLELLDALFMPMQGIGTVTCPNDLNRNYSDAYGYDEFGNVVAATRSYFDLFGKVVQTQGMNIADQKIVATQHVYDRLGRATVSTLPVVLTLTDFCYQPNLFSDNTGQPYSYDDFEKTNVITDAGSINNPNTVGGQSTANTLGWYYSNNNTLEPYTPTSAYPFSLLDYGDRSGGVVVRASAPGDAIRMGTGKESLVATLPVFDEMSDYLKKREFYVPSNTTNYDGASGLLTKNVLQDGNGKQFVTISDPSGLVLASCDVDGTLGTPISVKYNLYESNYSIELIACGGTTGTTCVTSDPRYIPINSGTPTSSPFQIVPDGSTPIEDEIIKVYMGTTIGGSFSKIYEGTVSEYNKTQPRMSIAINKILRIYTAKPNVKFKVSYTNAEVCKSRKLYMDYKKQVTSTTYIDDIKLKYAIVPKPTGGVNYPQYFVEGTIGDYYGPDRNYPLQYLSETESLYNYFYLQSSSGRTAPIDAVRAITTGYNPIYWNGQYYDNYIGLFMPLDNNPEGHYDYLGKSAEQFNNGLSRNTHWTLFQSGNDNFPIFLSDEPFELVFSTNGSAIVTKTVSCSAATLPDFTNPTNYVDFQVTNASDVISLTAKGGTATITNLVTNAVVYNNTTMPVPPGKATTTLVPGFYRATFASGDFNVENKLHYKDFTYYYYDDKGQLTNLISPKGVIYGDVNKPDSKYTTSYTYNSKGQLLSEVHPDRGTTENLYRTDGLLTVSQNAQQKAEGKCSYINYDSYDRVAEVGEYNLTANSRVFANMLQWEKGTYTGTALNPNNSVSNSGTEKTIYTYSGIASANGMNTQTNTRGQVSKTQKGTMFTMCSYDHYGRMKTVAKTVSAGDFFVNYTYTGSGELRSSQHFKYFTSYSHKHTYLYDAADRVKSYYFNNTASSNISLSSATASYSYYLHGGLKRKELGGKLQGLDYIYTLQGWLKGINLPPTTNTHGFTDVKSASGFQNDLFVASYDYYAGDYSNATVNYTSPTALPAITSPYYDGTVRSIAYEHNGAASPGAKTYAFTYDDKYRLKTASYGSYSWATKAFTANNAYAVGNLNYDAHGNIMSMTQIGADGVYQGPSDDFNYTYTGSGNQLSKVEGGPNGQGVRPVKRNYSYDAIGRMISEENGTLKYYSYNSDDQVVAVYSDVAKTKYIQAYTYDENASLYSVFNYATDGITITKKTWYINIDGTEPVVYTQDVAGGGGAVLEQIPLHSLNREGVYYKQLNETRYEITDHLGNVRSTFKEGTNGAVIQLSLSEYDPYGQPFASIVSSPAYPYGYQGQFSTWDGNLRENRFELRNYDPEIGRWKITDPYDQYHCAYAAMDNDPINTVDPDGGLAWPPKVGSKAATMTTMAVSYGNKVSIGVSHLITGTFSVLSRMDKFFEGDDGGAKYGKAIASITPAQSIANGVSYLRSGTDTDGNKTNGAKVAIDLVIELPLGKLVKGFKVSKGIFIAEKIKKSSKLLSWGNTTKGHLAKHGNVLGFGNYSVNQLQHWRMQDLLKAAINKLYNKANPALTRVGKWHQHDNAIMYISQGKMVVTEANGTFITVINKTSNNWYQMAVPIQHSPLW